MTAFPERRYADITIGALPDTKITGQVIRIYPKAKKEGNATLFDIEISISKTPGITLRAGFSATASIQIRERKQVLMLPERLVIFENGKRYVEVPETAGAAKGKKAKEIEKTRKVEITTGLSDGLNVEILTGMKEGDQVVERPPREIK